MPRRSLCIVTPALAAANNGNWQTASRWGRLLGDDYRVVLTDRWHGEPADAMLALHARRSAESIARWSDERPGEPLAVVLTGTDLYRDIPAGDPQALRSLDLADRLVVLHERAIDDLPLAQRAKAVVCFQSTSGRVTCRKTSRHLRAVWVGHLREVKAPDTFFAAARSLARRPDIRLDQIGAALEPAFGVAARELEQHCPVYRWLGALPHPATRACIQRAHLLVNTSRMEGGSHVVMEAVRSGTPVLATRVAGNVGLLGVDYGGYFDLGDGEGLANLLERCRDQPAILERLRLQCLARAPLFEPAREQAGLHTLLNGLFGTSAGSSPAPLERNS